MYKLLTIKNMMVKIFLGSSGMTQNDTIAPKDATIDNILELIRYWMLIPFLLSRNFLGATIMNFYRDNLILASILQVLISSFFLKRYFNNKIKQA